MKFEPKTEKELAEMNLLPEGEYGFEISGAEEKISKAGNEMIVLTVRIFKPDGSFQIITDYLMEALAFKLRHAADACGLTHEYETGILAAENFIGKTGMLKLKIQKDKNGEYPDKNTVGDYIVPKDGAPAVKPKGSNAAAETEDDGLEDKIPF